MKIYFAISVFAVSSLLMGCSEDVYYAIDKYKLSLEPHSLGIYPRDFEFGNGEEIQTGSVYSGEAWSFSSVPSWLSLSPSSGNSDAEFSITSSPNESVSNREAVFFISNNNTSFKIQHTLTASQTGSSPYIMFPKYSSSTIEIDGKNNKLIIDVDSNIPDITASFSESWGVASYNSDTKTVTVEIQANETSNSRKGIMTLKGTYITSDGEYSKSVSLTISQHSSDVSILEGGYMEFDADGGSQTRTISSDLPWTAKTTYPWIEFSPKSGEAGKSEMKITVLPSYESNERRGQIYLYFGDTEKKYIGITQSGRYLNVSPKKVTLSADENSSDKITIDSNIEWKVASCPEWLSTSQSSGNRGKTSVDILAQKNNSLNSRSGTIILKDSKSGGIESNVTVTQNGLDFGDQTTLEFNWHQSSLPLDIPLPGNWSAAVSDGWISLSDYTGTGEKTITVSVSQNNDEQLRTGTIVFSSEGRTIDVNIIQSGQYLTIESTNGEISAIGGDIQLSVLTSINVKTEIEYQSEIIDWIVIEQSDKGTYLIKILYNPSIKDRSAKFKIIPIDTDASDKYSQGVVFTIKQFGRKITSDKSKISMFAKGGTSDIVIINSDGEYSIEKDVNDYWYTLVPNPENNSFYIVVTENTSSTDRAGNIQVRLKNLPQGESLSSQIEVLQYSSDIIIELDPYDEDKEW